MVCPRRHRWSFVLLHCTVHTSIPSLKTNQDHTNLLDLFAMNMKVLTGSVGLIDHFIELIINGLNR